MNPELLRLEQVGFRYEDSEWELTGISFSLRPGEMLAIIGPNGSGKSTLLKLAAGVLAPSAGRVSWWFAGPWSLLRLVLAVAGPVPPVALPPRPPRWKS